MSFFCFFFFFFGSSSNNARDLSKVDIVCASIALSSKSTIAVWPRDFATSLAVSIVRLERDEGVLNGLSFFPPREPPFEQASSHSLAFRSISTEILSNGLAPCFNKSLTTSSVPARAAWYNGKHALQSDTNPFFVNRPSSNNISMHSFPEVYAPKSLSRSKSLSKTFNVASSTAATARSRASQVEISKFTGSLPRRFNTC